MKKIPQNLSLIFSAILMINCGAEDTANLAPVAENVSILGSFNIGQEISGTYTYSDAEGDQEGQSTYQWYEAVNNIGDGKDPIAGASTSKLIITEDLAGKFLAFEVIPTATSGTLVGDNTLSAYRGVNNTAPIASNVSITGDFTLGNELSVSYDFEDAEGDEEGASKFQWYRADDVNDTNKTKITGAVSRNYTLKVADVSRYILVEVTPIAANGASEGDPINSAYSIEITSSLRTSFTVKTYNKMVTGFYPSYKQNLLPLNEVKWGNLTHIIYAFAIPESDGDLNITALTNTFEFVSTAHANGVEAFFSIGGGAGSEGFLGLSADEVARAKFVENIEEFAYVNNFDGVDIDWEAWGSFGTVDQAESQNLIEFLKELKAALSRHNIKISIDLFASDFGGKHYFSELYDYVDWAHIMAYDFSGGFSSEPGHHSSLQHSMQALSYWGETRGLPKNKTILGVAFYGKEFTDVDNINSNTVINLAYRDILTNNPEAHLTDQIGQLYYTGVPTMKDKATIIANDNDYLGVMVWEIAHDTTDDGKSLLTALDQVLNP